jgi:glycosyltransferase involved in cell wall biosynthesis
MSEPAGRVSLVIPTYNGARFLGATLDSVFSQTLLPLEVLVVDDASADGTCELAEQRARGAPVAVQVIRLSHNSGGPARPINVGIGRARGEFIAVLDQDDVFLPRKLERQRRVLSDAALTVAFGLCADFDDPGRTLQSEAEVAALKACGEARDGWYLLRNTAAIAYLLRSGMFASGYPGMMFRRRDWERKGGVDEAMPIASDQELLLWLLLRGPAGFIPEPHYLRRKHGNNLSANREQIRTDNIRIYARHAPAVIRTLRTALGGDEVRGLTGGFGYWAREHGYYWNAARIHLAALWHGAGRWDDVAALAKLLPHYAARRLFSGR